MTTISQKTAPRNVPSPSEAASSPVDKTSELASTKKVAQPGGIQPNVEPALRSIAGPEKAPPDCRFELVRAQRSSTELKRIRQVDGPVTVGDSTLRQVAEPKIRSLAGETGQKPATSRPAALYLSEITLNENFNSFLSRTNQIYGAAIIWDLSGQPPRVIGIPERQGKEALAYAMRPNESLRFIGDGLQLWPQKAVEGGLHVQMVLMESDSDLRNIGEKIGKVREAVAESSLGRALAGFAAGPTGATIVAVEQAALALSQVVESVLKANDDDLVAIFQGTYGAENINDRRKERYDHRGASITLDLRPEEDAEKLKK